MTKSKAMALPGFVSDNSGRQTTFNDGSWGGPTCGYLISAKNLKSKSFNEVIKRAKDLSKSARQTSTKVPIATDKFLATNDHRATLVDELASEDSEEDNGDDNCKSTTISKYYLTDCFYYRIHSIMVITSPVDARCVMS
jgi:hypothetical protein